MKKTYLIFLIISIIACNEEEISSPIDQEPKSQLDSIYTVASDFYYWNSYLPSTADFDFDTHNTPSLILDAFRTYSPQKVDQWSFAIDQEEWLKLSEGIAGDFGLLLRFFDDNDLRVAYVQPNSSAGQNSVERGYQILKMNGLNANSDNREQLENELRVADVLDVEMVNNEGDQIQAMLNRSEYLVDPILNYDTYTYEGAMVGYLNLLTFSIDGIPRFLDIFSFFKSEGIEYLIIDLRYNGGGTLSSMERLANHMVCTETFNELMYETIYNDVYESFGEKKFFHEETSSICLKKISFITTEATASASEVLISALKPYADVSVIGTTTNGKLMGMHVIPYSDYTLVPVAFQILNKDGFHDDFRGLTPNVEVHDGVNKNWGTEEASIQAALENMIGLKNGRSVRSAGEHDFNVNSYPALNEIPLLKGALSD